MLFTELVQPRKLYARDPRYPVLADTLARSRLSPRRWADSPDGYWPNKAVRG